MGKGLVWAIFSLIIVACNAGGGNATIGAGTSFRNGSEHLQQVTFPDGSKAVLGPHTTVKLLSEGRELDLDGVAMFDIKSVVGQVFVVHTGNLNIEVLGTKFKVDAFHSEAGEEVDLLEGKLRVTKSYHSDSDSEPEVLNAGEMVMINRDIDLMEKEKLKPDELDKLRKELEKIPE